MENLLGVGELGLARDGCRLPEKRAELKALVDAEVQRIVQESPSAIVRDTYVEKGS